MELSKLLYDVREQLAVISDDRRIDDRYIEHLINVARANFIKQLLSKRPGYDVINLEQHWHAHIESASRSIFPNLTLDCSILRSTTPIPKMLTTDSIYQHFRVRTADIIKNTIEVIKLERANYITFEFNVMYAFLDYNHYLYLISKDNHQELKYAVVTGIFSEPRDIEDPPTEYPITPYMWSILKPQVVNALRSRPMEDPINNSEPDYIQPAKKDDKSYKEEQE